MVGDHMGILGAVVFIFSHWKLSTVEFKWGNNGWKKLLLGKKEKEDGTQNVFVVGCI
jgi:hypothetical protein